MKFHPLSEIFPLLAGAEFDELVDSIKTNGQREPIWLFEKKILDGRNRFNACKAAGVEPQFKEYTGTDPVAFVVDLNVRRRHLNESQRAMAASKLANMPLGGAKYRSANLQTDGVSQSDAADMLNVSTRSVASAAAVRDKGAPELVALVESGDVSVSKAAAIAQSPPEAQAAFVELVGNGASPNTAARQLAMQADEARVASLVARDERFPTLVIDPPWDYEWLSVAGRAAPQYATMSHEQLMALDVARWSMEESHLYLWVTNNFMTRGIELMRQWGWSHKTVLTWVKPRIGLGTYFRNTTEHVLFGVRGDRMTTRVNNIPTHFEAPIGKHSEKPEVFYEIVRAASHPRYGEGFQRAARPDFINLYIDGLQVREDVA